VLHDGLARCIRDTEAGDESSRARAGSNGAEGTYRMSLYIDCIILDSAWRTATSSPLASQSQAMVAGARHMAQSGSILMTDFRG